jgi:hypothetical protein
VREGYLERRQAMPARFARIDAVGTREEVWRRVEAALEARGW